MKISEFVYEGKPVRFATGKLYAADGVGMDERCPVCGQALTFVVGSLAFASFCNYCNERDDEKKI